MGLNTKKQPRCQTCCIILKWCVRCWCSQQIAAGAPAFHWYQRSTNSPELACVSWKAGTRTLVCCSENILLMHHWPCGTRCSYISFQLWVARSTSQSLRFFCCWMGAGFFLSCISWGKWYFLWLSGLRMRNFTWNRFPIKNLLIDSLLTPIVESTYLSHWF